MTLLDRLDNLMARESLNRRQLAIKTGIPQTTIYGWYDKGYEKMTLPSIKKLSEFFGCSMEYLVNGVDGNEEAGIPAPWYQPLTTAYERAEMPTRRATCNVLEIPYIDPGKPSVAQSETIPFNVMDIAAEDTRENDECEYADFDVSDFPSAAGSGEYISDQFEKIPIPKLAIPSNADCGIRIKGKSMEPDIPDGCVVFVETSEEIYNHQVGVFIINNDEAVCKRAKFNERGQLVRLMSDNPVVDDINVLDLEDIRVFGRVVGVYTGLMTQ